MIELQQVEPILCGCGCGKYLIYPYFNQDNHSVNAEDAQMIALIWDLGLRTFNANKRRRKKNMDNPGVLWK